MGGKVFFQTGSFLGEMGTDASGEIFVNSYQKGKGVLLEGVKRYSASADGNEIIEQDIDKSTGVVRATKVKNKTLGKTFRRSGSSVANQIEFKQINDGAFITVSGSNPGFNIIDTTPQSYWRARPAFMDFISGSEAFSILHSNETLSITDALQGGGTKLITFDQNDNITMTGTVSITGNTSVDGTLSATRKSFDIPHPSKPDKRLVYGSLEGPEFGVYIRGKIESDDKIPFPDYWVDLVNMDTLSVHLTPINSEKAIYFTFSDNKYIYINREAEFFYFVCAERKDIDRLQVEQ